MDFKLATTNEDQMRTPDTHVDMVELLSSPGNSSEPAVTPEDVGGQEVLLHLDTPKSGKNVHHSPVPSSSTPKNNQEGLQTQDSHVKSKKRISQKSVSRTETGKKSKLAPLVVQLDYDEVAPGSAGGGDDNILEQDHYA